MIGPYWFVMHQKKSIQPNLNSLSCYPLSNQIPSRGSMKKSYSTLAGKAIYIFVGFAVLGKLYRTF